MRKKILVVGWEGADWRTLEPLLDAGRLPRLRSLLSNGCRGTLVSPDPEHSPSAWASVWTGCGPCAHGVTGTSCSRKDLRRERVWDILSGQGWTVGLAGALLTSPPSARPGDFIFGDPLSISPESLPCGHEFLHELAGCHLFPRAFVHRLPGLAWASRSSVAPETLARMLWCAGRLAAAHLPGEDLRHLLPELQARILTDCFLRSCGELRPDFAYLHLEFTKTMLHSFWPERLRAASRIGDAFQLADELLGRALDWAGRDRIVLVVSAHGMADPAPGAPARFRPDYTKALRLLGVRTEALWGRRYCDRLRLAASGPDGRRTLASLSKGISSIRWARGGGPVFRAAPAGPADGNGLELRPGFDDGPPDSPIVLPSGMLFPRETLLPEFRDTVVHHPEGLFVLSGPGIRKGRDCAGRPALGLAPTLLKLCGAAGPAPMMEEAPFGDVQEGGGPA